MERLLLQQMARFQFRRFGLVVITCAASQLNQIKRTTVNGLVFQ